MENSPFWPPVKLSFAAEPEATRKRKMRSAATARAGRYAPASLLGATQNDALLEQKQILAAPLLWFQIPQPFSPAAIFLVFRESNSFVSKL